MGKRIWALLALGLALIIMVPVMGHADQHHRRGHDDAVITISERDGGHRVVVRGGDETWEFEEDDWEDLEEMLAEVGVNIDETMEQALESLEDVDWDDLDLGRHGRRYARLHDDLDLEGLEGLEELGEKLGRMGERLAEQFEREFDDHEGRWEKHGERWEDIGGRLAERIERQMERNFGRDFERDVRRPVERDVARGFRGHDVHVDIDDHLDTHEVHRTERDIRKQMRRLQKELRRLERELERLEDDD